MLLDILYLKKDAVTIIFFPPGCLAVKFGGKDIDYGPTQVWISISQESFN